MTDNTGEQVTSLSDLINSTPYSNGSDSPGVNQAPVAGVLPGMTPGAGVYEDQGSSPAVGTAANTGQTPPVAEYVTPLGMPEVVSPNALPPISPSQSDPEIHRLQEVVAQQTALLQKAEGSLTAVQRQNQQLFTERIELAAKQRNAEFQKSLEDLDENERAARIYQREAFIANQRLQGLQQQQIQTENARQMDSKGYLAQTIAHEAGLPPAFAEVLFHKSQNLDHMNQLAIDYAKQLGGQTMSPQAQYAQQSANIAQQGQQFTQPFQQPGQQQAQEQELPSPAWAGAGSTPSATMQQLPEVGSGDILGLIQGTAYTRVQ